MTHKAGVIQAFIKSGYELVGQDAEGRLPWEPRLDPSLNKQTYDGQ